VKIIPMLNNLSLLYINMENLLEGEKVYGKFLEIYKKLSSLDSSTFFFLEIFGEEGAVRGNHD